MSNSSDEESNVPAHSQEHSEGVVERSGMSGIRTLNILNFKSWLGEHTIGPFHTFSCIVGSNGSGKSNLMDAISFVLGVKTQQLRGQNVHDLIHRTADVKATPLQKAYVELVYEHGDAANTITCFRKSVSRNSGTAAYSVNGKKCSWSMYESRLREFGVIVRARNFLVFQGDVESIAHKSPSQLTEVFEHISGSFGLRDEFNSLHEESKDAESVFLRCFEKKKSVLKERKHIKEQKDEAERFQAMQQEFKEHQRQFFLWQLYHMHEELENIRQTIDENQHNVQNKSAACVETETELKEVSKEVGKLRRQRGVFDKNQSQLSRDIDKARTACTALHEEFRHVSAVLMKSDDVYAHAKRDAADSSKLLDELKHNLVLVSKLLQDLDEKRAGDGARHDDDDDDGGELLLEQSQLDEYNVCKKRAATKTSSLREERERVCGELTSLQAVWHDDDERIRSLNAHKTQLRDMKKKSSERIDAMQRAVDDIEAKRDEVQLQLQAVQVESKHTDELRESLNVQLADVERDLLDNRVERVQSERETKLSDALLTMQRLFAGVLGRLSSLCRPVQRRYNSAVAIALGKNLNAIVVDSRRTALECIRYLKEQRVGTATFLPLDSLTLPSTSEFPDVHRRYGERVKLVRDVIDADESILQAVLFACGNALVADTLQDARRVAFDASSGGRKRVKIVTLEGDLLHKSGNMSGGASRDKKDSAADTWDRHKMTLVKSKRDHLITQLSELPVQYALRSREQTLQSQLAGHASRLSFTLNDLKLSTDNAPTIDTSLTEVDEELKSLQPQLQHQKNSINQLESRLLQLDTKIGKQEDKIFSEFSRSVGVVSIREYEEKRLKVAKERSERRVNLCDQISRLQNEIEYQSKKCGVDKVLIIEQKMVNDRSHMKQVQKQLRLAERDVNTLQKDCDKLKEQSNDTEKQLIERSKTVKTLKDDLALQQTELSNENTSISALECDAEKIRQRHADLLQTACLEQIEIPLMKAKIRNTKNRVGAHKRTSRTKKHRSSRTISNDDDSMNTSDDEYDENDDENDDQQMQDEELNDDEDDDDDDDDDEATVTVAPDIALIDYSELRQRESFDDEREFQTQKSAYQNELSKLAAELDAQAPNLKATQRFDEFKERVKTTLDELESTRSSTKETASKFALVRQKRLEMFMTAFHHVSDTIDKVYKELTQSQDFPLGGTAFLSLENAENPFDGGIKYSAMPPMKRFRDMEQLSGGEKTVAALALLFSIHSFQPSPFFVLDEIDAALDKANVTKVARYVRGRARNDGLQCIVISLKDTFFDKADALIGVYRDRETDSSGCVTMDLSVYAQ